MKWLKWLLCLALLLALTGCERYMGDLPYHYDPYPWGCPGAGTHR